MRTAPALFSVAAVALVLLAASTGVGAAQCVTYYPAVPTQQLPSGFLDDALKDVFDTFNKSFTLGGGATGFAYAVNYGNEIIGSGEFGVTDHDTQRPITLDTPFRVMSVTKVVTSLTMLALRDLGRIRIDVPASDYVPELRSMPLAYLPSAQAPRKGTTFTLQDLSMHSSGLPEHPPCDEDLDTAAPDRTCNTTYVEVLGKLARAGGPPLPPNRQPLYSNIGMALLGIALARSQNHSVEDAIVGYAQLARQHVLDPLGMSSTGFDLETVENTLARAYDANGNLLPIAPVAFQVPSHGMYSTVRDLVQLTASTYVEERPQDPSNGVVVSDASMRAAMRGSAHYQQPSGELYDAFGMGWRVRSQPTNDERWGEIVFKFGHKGDYYSALVASIPSLRIGISLALTNGPVHDDSVQSIGMWQGLDVLANVLAPAMYSVLTQALPPLVPAPPSFPVDALTGKYFVHGAAPIPVGPISVSVNEQGIVTAKLPGGISPGGFSGTLRGSFSVIVKDERTDTKRYIFQLHSEGEHCDTFTEAATTVSFFQQGDCMAFLLPEEGSDVTGLKYGSDPSCVDIITL